MPKELMRLGSTPSLGLERCGELGPDASGGNEEVSATVDEGQHVRRFRSFQVAMAANAHNFESSRSDEHRKPPDEPTVMNQPSNGCVGAGL